MCQAHTFGSMVDFDSEEPLELREWLKVFAGPTVETWIDRFVKLSEACPVSSIFPGSAPGHLESETLAFGVPVRAIKAGDLGC